MAPTCPGGNGIDGRRRAVKWLRDLGIFGQRSHEKRLPEAVFTLSNDQIALLLRHLWATDGVQLRKARQSGDRGVHFSSCSRGLARDVAALLLRLGIVAASELLHGSGVQFTWSE